MTQNILYKEEITSSIEKLVDQQKIVSWDEFIIDMKDFIISKYDHKPLATYKGDWKRRFKASMKLLGYKFGGSVDDCWEESINSVLKPSVDSKKSANSNCPSNIITKKEKEALLDILNRVKDSDKWVLSTNKVVEDVFKEIIANSVFEHPVHSFILDLSDTLWEKHFTEEEIHELKHFKVKAFKPIPDSLQEYLDSYDGLGTADNIRKYAFTHYLNNEQFEKKWVQQSVISAVDLFLDDSTLDLSDMSEADILHRVWGFVYHLFDDKGITAKIGEKSSVAVSLAKNVGRNLELEEKRIRKVIGSKVDILFKHAYDELGSCEIGKDQVTEVDDKYLDDGRVKLPKTLRDMICMLVKKNPTRINSIVTVGYLMMGISIELVFADVPVGSLICRIIRTEKYEFPQTIDTFAVDFLPLLETAWTGKEIMRETVTTVQIRKRKSVSLQENAKSFPCSFYHRPSTSATEADIDDHDITTTSSSN